MIKQHPSLWEIIVDAFTDQDELDRKRKIRNAMKYWTASGCVMLNALETRGNK